MSRGFRACRAGGWLADSVVPLPLEEGASVLDVYNVG